MAEHALPWEALAAFIGDLEADGDVELPKLLWEDVLDLPPPAETVATAPMTPRSSLAPVAHTEQVEPRAPSIGTTPLPAVRPLAWPAAKPKSRNPSRTRRRDEVLYLRGVVGDLEKRLGALRKCVATASVTDPSKELVATWAQVATRQFERRMESEMENATLKRLLQDQIHVGKNLEMLLRTMRPSLQSLHLSAGPTKLQQRINPRPWECDLVFDELVACCEQQYSRTSWALAQFSDAEPVIKRRETGVVYDAELGLTLQNRERRVVPFNYKDTASELWSLHSSVLMAHRVHDYGDVDQDEYTLKIKFRVVVEVNGAQGDLSVRMAMRRFVEPARTVITMSGIIEPGGFPGVMTKDVRVPFSAWNILEPTDSVAGDASCSGTVLTNCLVTVPEVDGGLHDRSRKVGLLTEVLLRSIAVEVDCRSQNLENRLFQRVFNHRRGE